MAVIPFPARPDPAAPLVESATTRALLLPPGAPLPPDADALLEMPDGARFVYAPRAPGGPPSTLKVDPFQRGNKFTPIHDSPRALGALLSIAASRRVGTGPESERVFVFLRGTGLLFLENGDAERFEPHSVALVPAGEPARVWAQGPEDALVVVLQPKGAPVEKRTLASEIARRRAPP